MIEMLVTGLVKNLLYVLRYPAFSTRASDLVGDHGVVGAVQTRIPDGGVACQIHYPIDPDQDESSSTAPYFRPAAVEGLADYTRQSSSLLGFLAQPRTHPCRFGVPPAARSRKDGDDGDGFPVVIFSHGLGGCMEMYTALCQQMASLGYCVVALEHEDGSGAYAERATDGTPVFYRRPDDTPYSREKVVNFRKPFLAQRVREIDRVLDYLKQRRQQSASGTEPNDHDKEVASDDVVRQVLAAVDTRQGVHLLGHSFGGASMVQALQDESFVRRHGDDIRSLTLLDCWAFSLPDAALARGVRGPVLSLLSEAWLTNPETTQLVELLQNTTSSHEDDVVVASYHVPHTVHASFSDAGHWFPGVVARRLGVRAAGERRHVTARTVAATWRRFIASGGKPPSEDDSTGVVEYPLRARTRHGAESVSASSSS